MRKSRANKSGVKAKSNRKMRQAERKDKLNKWAQGDAKSSVSEYRT